MKHLNDCIKPEDYKAVYNIWLKSSQDRKAIDIICDLYRVLPQEAKRVIEIGKNNAHNRMIANTKANNSIINKEVKHG